MIRHLDLTKSAIGLLIGLVWIVQGVVALLAGIMGGRRAARGWAIAFGIISLVAGIVVVSVPDKSVTVLATLLGIWFIVMGLFELAAGFVLRSELKKAGGLSPGRGRGVFGRSTVNVGRRRPDGRSWRPGSPAGTATELVDTARTFTGTTAEGILLVPGETVFLEVGHTALVEERRGPGTYVGTPRGSPCRSPGSAGRQIRYRVGATKGHYVQGTPAPTAIDTGTTFITSARVVFRGGARPASARSPSSSARPRTRPRGPPPSRCPTGPSP